MLLNYNIMFQCYIFLNELRISRCELEQMQFDIKVNLYVWKKFLHSENADHDMILMIEMM